MILKEAFSVQLEGEQRYLNITPTLQGIVEKWGLTEGPIDVSVLHTTCAILVNEEEPCLLNEDLFWFLDQILPPEVSYVHDSKKRTVNLDPDRHERVNGHAHLRALFTNSSASVPLYIEDGKLALGQWQKVLFFDFDNLEGWRERTIVVRAEFPDPCSCLSQHVRTPLGIRRRHS